MSPTNPADAAGPFRRLAADLARNSPRRVRSGPRPNAGRGPAAVRSWFQRAAALARRFGLPAPDTLHGGEPARTPGDAALAVGRQLDGLQRWAEERAAELAAGGRVGV